jgi:putative transposase
MITGILFDCEIGPYSGKESGETALLWKLLSQLRRGDILVADSYCCTYWLVAACIARGVHIVMKNHHKRDDNPIHARRINKRERTVIWDRPPRPEWMSEEVYAEQPATVEVRLVDVQVHEPGFRTKGFTVATTMLDHKLNTAAWIGSVYRSRWLVELDIRSIKCSLGMDVLRVKTPEMVRTEFWSCLLAYNLIRAKMLQSCAATGRDPRSLSFTTTMQLLGTNWLLCAVIGVTPLLAELGQDASSSEVAGHRPDRVEPRVNKRRPKVLALMTKPRREYHAELGAAS